LESALPEVLFETVLQPFASSAASIMTDAQPNNRNFTAVSDGLNHYSIQVATESFQLNQWRAICIRIENYYGLF